MRRGPPVSAADTMVRIGLAAALPSVLTGLGVDPSEVLSEMGIDPELFDNPDNRISYLTRGRLIAHCAARTACPHFGLLVGQQAHLQSFGLIGLLARSSPDAGAALRNLVRHFHHQARGATVALEVTDDFAVLSYQSYQPQAVATDQVGDAAMAIAFNILRELCGRDWVPVEIHLAHHKPLDIGPFKRFFGVPVRFDHEQYAIVFSASWLKRPLPGLDPTVRGLVQAQIDKLDAHHADDFAEQVRSALRQMLVSADPSADLIARLFSMNRRTMNRRLNALGTTYQQVVDEVSFEIARQMLEHSTMDMAEIAAIFDYANASAFARAFRRWSGTTPAQWRMKATGAGERAA